MSKVEIAVRKVKGLSEKQARALLDWLATQDVEPKRTALRPGTRRRKRKTYPSMRELMAWYDSIRGTTDWEIPKMPPDLVRKVSW